MRYLIVAVVATSIAVLPAAAQAAANAPDGRPEASSSLQPLRTVKTTLRKDVKRALRRVRKLDLARVEAKGFALKRIRALVAGRASAAATMRSATTPGSASQASRVTVARGSRTLARPGRSTVRLKLSRSGKKVLEQVSRVTLTVKVVFTPRTGGRVGARFKVTLKRKGEPGGQGAGGQGPGSVPSPTPPVPSGPIPANARLQYFQTFDTPAPWSGLSTQCAHAVQSGKDAGDGYAHFEVRPGEPSVAGHERCEVSYGGFDRALPAGEYWYRSRMRAGAGFPHAPIVNSWVTLQQWQEDRPAPGTNTGTVDGAILVNSGPSTRMYIQGDRLPILQAPPFGINAWNEFIVHGVWTDQPNGYLEWWINGVYRGRTTGVTSETGGRHFWKGGITRSDSIDTLQSADISNVEIWRAP